MNVVTEKYKAKFNKYKEIINDKFWGDYKNQPGLNGRLLNFYDEDIKDKTDEYILDHSEAVLIWNIYETIRQNAYKTKIFALNNLDEKMKENYLNKKVEVLPDGKAPNQKNAKSNRFAHNKDMKWLEENINKLKTEYANPKRNEKIIINKILYLKVALLMRTFKYN
ncbi:hypothetical protein [Mycoplasmopsis cynos]|uniref:hypothetical protein n=1 Tax=Mycoplasmopsis cynos TaxID=171284 RepID=UPI00220E7B01|nr:hypothetical protein [Mycoplasmopsis cynos]UWV81268.1 hypothetical protein NW065_04855 [Mycoplasmopsis cynos]